VKLLKHIIGFLVLVVLISGCVNTTDQRPVNTVSTEGIQINKFDINPAFANENEIVTVDVEIENVGGATAKNVKATLVGTSGTWRSTGGSVLTADQNMVDITSLDPPKPSENIPGDFKIAVKAIKPPDLPEGVETDFPLALRVDYDYQTSGSVVIPTIEKSLYVEQSRSGKSIASTSQVSNNNAPLKVALGAGGVPAVIDSTGSGNTESFVIEVQNVGSGLPISLSTNKVGQITAAISALGSVQTLNCLGNAGTGTPKTVTITAGDETKLRSTGKVSIPCDVTFNTLPAGSTGTLVFTVDLDYRYFITEGKTVKIEGRA
jgi:hypothetical protein